MADSVRGGAPVEKVARKYKVTLQTVRSACREYGVPFETRAARCAVRRAEIATFVGKGATVTEACAHFGATPATVKNACLINSVEVAPKGRPMTENTYKVIALLCTTDAPMVDIAAKTGRPTTQISAIYARCKRAGVPVRVRVQGRKRGAKR